MSRGNSGIIGSRSLAVSVILGLVGFVIPPNGLEGACVGTQKGIDRTVLDSVGSVAFRRLRRRVCTDGRGAKTCCRRLSSDASMVDSWASLRFSSEVTRWKNPLSLRAERRLNAANHFDKPPNSELSSRCALNQTLARGTGYSP
jgi:hypothetical protein